MKAVFIILTVLHGLIHLLGTIKSVRPEALADFSTPVGKTAGFIWLLAAILFIVCAILFGVGNKYWWGLAIVAVLMSQILIFSFWSDAKFGTIPNVIILLISVIGYFSFQFERVVHQEVQSMLSASSNLDLPVVNDSTVSHLPQPVQNWLMNSGIANIPPISNVRLEQRFKLKMNQDQKDWYHANAMQYFTVERPAFNWTINMKMFRFFPVTGRDKFESGQGAMLIQLLSMITVVNDKAHHKINQGSLQRYLAEIVWFPGAALSPYITWEGVDEFSAKATMRYEGTEGSGVFTFDESGRLKNFTAMRYMGGDDAATLQPWTIVAREHGIFDGIEMPVVSDAVWEIPDGDFHWATVEVTDVRYNIK